MDSIKYTDVFGDCPNNIVEYFLDGYIAKYNIDIDSVYMIDILDDKIILKYKDTIIFVKFDRRESKSDYSVYLKLSKHNYSFMPKLINYGAIYSEVRAFYYLTQEYVQGIPLSQTGDKMEELTIRLLKYRDMFSENKSFKPYTYLPYFDNVYKLYIDLIQKVYDDDPCVNETTFTNLKSWIEDNVKNTSSNFIRHRNLTDDNILYNKSKDQLYIISWHEAYPTIVFED
jgi:hypothetical protein